MDWYSKLAKTAAAKPPAYLEERVSDLIHASEIVSSSPSEARTVISSVMAALRKHHNDVFAEPLGEALKVLADSPAKARAMLRSIASAMLAEREAYENEKDKPKWKMRN